MTGSQLLIGSPLNDSGGTNSGKTFLYYIRGDEFILEFKEVGEAAGDEAGHSVAFAQYGDHYAVGALNNDGGELLDSGHARVYQYFY